MASLLSGKRILVIGGTTGLGLSAAQAMVAEGARVLVTGRTQETATAAANSLGESGASLVSDATDPHSAEQAISHMEERWEGVDGLYHVAGGSGRSFGDGPLHEMTDEGLQRTLDLNLTSLIYSNRAMVRYLLQQGKGGSILNMGSVLGYSPSPRYFASHAYATAKGGIIGFSKSCAAYYAPHNIRFNVIAPAVVATPMAKRVRKDEEILGFLQTKQPLAGGRIGEPRDCDGAALYLLSDAGAYTTGQVLAVDGGWSVSEGQHPQPGD